MALTKPEVAGSNPVGGTTSVALRNLITWSHFNFRAVYLIGAALKLLRVTRVSALMSEVEPGYQTRLNCQMLNQESL